MNEQVNHPSHYLVNGKECIDCMVELLGLKATCIFCLTNAYKYMYRAGNKDGNSYEQDMRKCRWYIEWASKHIESKNYGLICMLEKVSEMYEEITNGTV